MSKYRVVISPSNQKRAVIASFYFVLLVSVWLWQPNMFEHQFILQSFASALIGILWRREALADKSSSTPTILSVDDEGQCAHLDAEKESAFQITNHSLVSSHFVWLSFRSSSLPLKTKWQLIYRDQVSEQDYRRLCRVALRQKMNKQVSN